MKPLNFYNKINYDFVWIRFRMQTV